MKDRATAQKRVSSHVMQIALIDSLEPRALFSATVVTPIPQPVDVSRLAGNQAEESIAIDPVDPRRMFLASNMLGSSMFGAISNDAGATWSGREFADGTDGIPRALSDPSAAFDNFGNLFFSYLNSVDGRIDLVVSTDGGQHFALVMSSLEQGDQPTVAVGRGMVWMTFERVSSAGGGAESEAGSGAVAYAAPVYGLGNIGKFAKKPQVFVAQGPGQNVGDIAIGPDGQVMVAYARTIGGEEGPAQIAVQLDADGLKHKTFSAPQIIGSTNVGDHDVIPASAHRTIDAEVALAYDNSGGQYTGRVYMVYTDETPDESNNTDIYLRFSDNDGQSWSTPVRVNDDNTTNSQFFPRIAVDPTSGNVALSWYDCRNDTGAPGMGSLDAIPNNEPQVYGVVGSPAPDGVSFSPNFQITAGVSSALNGVTNPNDFGDYTGLAFFGGKIHPAWADNAGIVPGNPDGAMDALTSTLTVSSDTPPVGGPTAKLIAKPVSRRGSYKFQIVFTDFTNDLDVATLDSNDTLVTGPNGFAAPAQFTGARRNRRTHTLTATYKLTPARGPRASGPGLYTISLQPNQVADTAGRVAAGRTLFGTFLA